MKTIKTYYAILMYMYLPELPFGSQVQQYNTTYFILYSLI